MLLFYIMNSGKKDTTFISVMGAVEHKIRGCFPPNYRYKADLECLETFEFDVVRVAKIQS